MSEQALFDTWWFTVGKDILDRRSCAKAAWKEAKTVRVHDVDEFYRDDSLDGELRSLR